MNTTTSTIPSARRPNDLVHPRLGRVEAAILDALRASSGVIQRDEARDHAFPRLRAAAMGGRARSLTRREKLERARAEAAVSRAIQSLERKALLVREHSPHTGRTVLMTPDRDRLPDWEEMARAEEDLAAHCLRVSGAWTELARRSRRRAATMRAERAVEATEAERQADLDEIGRLHGER